jgi:hypothetical protein
MPQAGPLGLMAIGRPRVAPPPAKCLAPALRPRTRASRHARDNPRTRKALAA